MPHDSASRMEVVAPLAGAWIEIVGVGKDVIRYTVAPLAGAWIEIFYNRLRILYTPGRTPRGCVD